MKGSTAYQSFAAGVRAALHVLNDSKGQIMPDSCDDDVNDATLSGDVVLGLQ